MHPRDSIALSERNSPKLSASGIGGRDAIPGQKLSAAMRPAWHGQTWTWGARVRVLAQLQIWQIAGSACLSTDTPTLDLCCWPNHLGWRQAGPGGHACEPSSPAKSIKQQPKRLACNRSRSQVMMIPRRQSCPPWNHHANYNAVQSQHDLCRNRGHRARAKGQGHCPARSQIH